MAVSDVQLPILRSDHWNTSTAALIPAGFLQAIHTTNNILKFLVVTSYSLAIHLILRLKRNRRAKIQHNLWLNFSVIVLLINMGSILYDVFDLTTSPGQSAIIVPIPGNFPTSRKIFYVFPSFKFPTEGVNEAIDENVCYWLENSGATHVSTFEKFLQEDLH